MVMFLLLGLICGISGNLLDKPVLTPVLYIGCALCGLIFSGLVFSPMKKGLEN
ncbi:hypothetical protein C672_2551 [[Clostridium] bifermentans ATCC 638]|uniref:Uncharacterized protein n=2 Tax=Paraclostridium bifermentans TaxID=1490 RepID=T4VSE4_PARBF|nr:hypothetical protein C672_2551 [[Clostridium] bifermentans ATCC 638] [Paraclostridium bifermentans ATCC 638 = DSM 14991]